jgi:competence protein ComEC
VLEIRLGIVSIVLAGDIGREGERTIVPRLEPGRLTILKAGHHGSATSSTAEFLDALRPAVVIFSAGRDNRFGHPHPDVLRRFAAMGTAIFRTDRDGTVMMETDGRVVSVESYTGGTMLLAPGNAVPNARSLTPRTKTRRHEDTTGATQ